MSEKKPKEKDVLADFWWHVSQDTRREVRLDWLRRLANVKVFCKWGWDPEAVRANWEARRDRGLFNPAGICFACLKPRRGLVQHHVVQIRNGGSDEQRNRVTICGRCHADIHPWLKWGKSTRSALGGWKRQRQVG